MKFDFTLNIYLRLLAQLKKSGYRITTFEQYLSGSGEKKIVILRHDVDRQPANALIMAKLENKLSIKSSYYFRYVKKSNNPSIIKQIVNMGHEIGYHYEDLALAFGDFNIATDFFEKHLSYFRQYYQVKTICMHGSPLSKWDNRMLWEKLDYKKYDITGEPYFDLDFNRVGYFTDTGRKWNSSAENVRDKVHTNYHYPYRSSFELIEAIKRNRVPNHIMISVHPQRWTNNYIKWILEIGLQSAKNNVKKIIAKWKDK